MCPFKGPPPPPQDWAFPKSEGILSCSLLSFQYPAFVGVAAVALGRCPTHSSGQRQSRVCWAGAAGTTSVPGGCEHKPSLLHTHLPPPTPNPQPLPTTARNPTLYFHKAFNFSLRDSTLGLDLGRSAGQPGCQWVPSLGGSEMRAPFSPPLTCGSLKMKTQIETTGLCNSPPR